MTPWIHRQEPCALPVSIPPLGYSPSLPLTTTIPHMSSHDRHLLQILNAVDEFHSRHPDLALAINVTRHPYSFVGDRGQQPMRQGELDGIGTDDAALRTFSEQMAGRMPAASDEKARRERMRPFLALGEAAGISFDLEVRAQYQPIESQRLLLWAGWQGRQEAYMAALNTRHFERRQSASLRSTCLAAAADVGLDAAAAEAFLETNELEAEVWRSYGATIREAGIRSIPLFSFSVPAIDANGGPFRRAGEYEAYIVRGSSGKERFVDLFELIARDVAAGAREYDGPAFPFRRDEWWAARRRAQQAYL